MSVSPLVQQRRGQLTLGDGIGTGMQEAPESTRVGTQDVAAFVQVLENLHPQPVEVDDLGREPGRFELGLELGECRPRGGGTGTNPFELGWTAVSYTHLRAHETVLD